MLHYFPTPYPDELWYSVLCRYHVRSGNRDSAHTFRNLLNGKSKGSVSSFLPSSMIREIAGQLPEGMLDVREIALNHTLFKYAFRFQTLEDKEALLSRSLAGKINFPILLPKPYQEKALKYCPLCIKEDMERYGETYWHTAHQIPYASVCHKHQCRLHMLSGLKIHSLNFNFLTPDTLTLNEPDFNVSQTEIDFTKILTTYLTLPLSYGPTDGYNNLYEGLIDAGYGSVRKDHYYSIDFKRLGNDLCNRFGKEMIETHFGTTIFRAMMMGQFHHWLYKMPERYAVISLFLNQDPETTFGPFRENQISRTFRELSQSGVKMKKKYIAEKTGLKETNLDILAHNLVIEPFWERRERTGQPKRYRSNLAFTKEEWEYLNQQVEKYGYHSISEYVRRCLHEVWDHEKTAL